MGWNGMFLIQNRRSIIMDKAADSNNQSVCYRDGSTLNESQIERGRQLSELTQHRRYQSIIDGIRNQKRSCLEGVKVEREVELKEYLREKRVRGRDWLPEIKVGMIQYPKLGKKRKQTLHQVETGESPRKGGRLSQLKSLHKQRYLTEKTPRKPQSKQETEYQQNPKSQLLNQQMIHFGQFLRTINDRENNPPVSLSKTWKKVNHSLSKPYQLYTDMIKKYNNNNKFLIKGESLAYLTPHPIYYLKFYQTHMPNNPNFHLRFVKAFFKDGKEPFTYNKFQLFYQIFIQNNLKHLDVPTFIYDFFAYQGNLEPHIHRENFNDTLKMLVENSLESSHSLTKVNDIFQYIKNQIETKIREREGDSDPQLIDKEVLKSIIMDNPDISFILFVMMMRRED